MRWIDYALLALVAAAVFLAARQVVKRKKTGGGAGCSGDCAHCAEAQQERKHDPPRE